MEHTLKTTPPRTAGRAAQARSKTKVMADDQSVFFAATWTPSRMNPERHTGPTLSSLTARPPPCIAANHRRTTFHQRTTMSIRIYHRTTQTPQRWRMRTSTICSTPATGTAIVYAPTRQPRQPLPTRPIPCHPQTPKHCSRCLRS